MKEKIEKFKKMTLKEQKEILLIILEKSIYKSELIFKLFNNIKNINNFNQYQDINN